MSLFVAVLRQEWRLQWRTGRLRIGLLAYVLLCALPPAVVAWLVVPASSQLYGPATYLAQTLALQPVLTALVAVLVAGNRSDVGALEEIWCPLASAAMGGPGWMIRRWLALVALLLPVSFVPELVSMAIAMSVTGQTSPFATVAGLWLVRIAPLVVLVSALWLAMVTITGGELAAAVMTLVLSQLGPSLLNRLAFSSGFRFGDSLDLVGIMEARVWFLWTGIYLTKPGSRQHHPGFAATEGPFDRLAGWEWLLPNAALLAVGTSILFAAALFFTRRTRRDQRPLVVRGDHPLRNLIAYGNTLRQRYAPGAGHSPLERALLIPGLLVAGAILTAMVDRQLDRRALATNAYETLKGEKEQPTALEVVPDHWRVAGELDARGGVELVVRAGMLNSGREPAEHLAFMLNPALEVSAIRAEGYRLASERSWDRLLLRPEPPLPPGGRLELEMEIEGTPLHPDFGLEGRRRALSFVEGFERQAAARFSDERHDFSRSTLRPAISRRSIDLRPADLLPVPRYTTWKLSPPPSSPGLPGQYVLGEQVLPATRLEVDLGAPGSWVLVDSCAHLRPATETSAGGPGDADAEPTRLQGSCTVPLGEWVVMGGKHELITGSDGGAVAMLGPHLERGANLLSSLDKVLRLTDRAWPGLGGLDGLVVLERPPMASAHLREGLERRWQSVRLERLYGRLVVLPERQVIGDQQLGGEALVALSVAGELMRRRDFDSTQQHLFQALLRSLVLRRMGLDENGAVAAGAPWLRAMLDQPFLEADRYNSEVLDIGLPALMVEVESRLGPNDFYRAMEVFLSADEAPPATLADLFTTLSTESGVALDRMYRDYFEEGAVPRLRLEEVADERTATGWRVRGQVQNSGTGQVQCPLVVRTELGEERTRLTIDSESSTNFSVETVNRPVRVLLDPQKTCYRLGGGTTDVTERVELGGEA